MTIEVYTTAGVKIPLDRIVTDYESQARVKVHTSVVCQYAEAMREQLSEGGLQFPPVVLFSDEQQHWIGDGFHRVLAARQAELTEILAEVRPGNQRDALLYCITSNQTHGLPRTNADKRRAVGLLLRDQEWSQWSDREIARRCQVGHILVGRLRRGASGSKNQMRARKVQRGGQVYEMTLSENGAAAQTPSPPTDALELPVPEPRVPTFSAQAKFNEARELLDRVATIVDDLAQSPAGELYRTELVRSFSNGALTFACPALRSAYRKLTLSEPYCAYCPNCYEPHPGLVRPLCKKCGGRGWTTRAAFDSCSEDARKRIMKLATPTARSGEQPHVSRGSVN
jgi:hypothetical protein